MERFNLKILLQISIIVFAISLPLTSFADDDDACSDEDIVADFAFEE